MEKALLLDATYADNEERSIIQLYLYEKKKGEFWLKDDKFRPYLYASCKEGTAEKIAYLKGYSFGNEEPFKVHDVIETKMKMNDETILKVLFNKVTHLVTARKELGDIGFGKYEHDIPYLKRYLIDHNLEPGNWIEYEEKCGALKKINPSDGKFDVPMVAFDIETWAGEKFGVGLEEIMMSATVDGKKERIVSHNTKKIKGLEIVDNEEKLIGIIQEELNKYPIIVTYNGDNFDLSYVKERAKKLGTTFEINGKSIRTKRHGLDNAVELYGKQHIDAYQIMKFLQRTGSINIVKLDLENVSEKVFGITKEKVTPKQGNDAWKTGKGLERFVNYNKEDANTTLRIAKDFLPLFIEISKLTSQTLQTSTRANTSMMVEDLLLKENFKRKQVAPNKPKEGQIRVRINNPIKGAFVKEPLAGLHENITVLDFASLYPSIIIAHNISPETVNCSHKECKKNKSPDGTWFCQKEKGLFPEILSRLLKERLKLKAEYKKKKKEGTDDKILFAKQWALKIILNSAYGYLGYARARWYSRESASAITSWARQYIHETSSKIEKEGFEILYNDTDSAVLLMGKKTKKDIETLLKKINNELPATMELELDGYYKRGIFVTKKEGGAAKKRYAFIDENDNLKIVGFEYVRRDWCNLAKETQRKVIELVLKEGEPEKAAEYVRGIIKDLKSGKVKKEELTIITMMKRKVEDYDSIGPHVAAAKKAIKRGKDVGVGSLLSFIITKNGKSISDRAELEEFVKEGDYDGDYYIKNQIIPAVIKIIRELGYTEEDLIHGGKQTGLAAWD